MTGSAAGDSDAALLQAVRNAFLPETPARIGIAVSGGGDSMALLHLMHRRAAEGGPPVAAVTVDHGLRPESAAEAACVAAFCAARGIPHQTLRWQGPSETGNLMDQARRARLRLIAAWAQGAGGPGIGHVVLGHTADDQAESFLMNLGRAAGIDGLSGMRPAWREQGIHWARPLLGHSRAALRDYLRRHHLPWVDDPSNDNDRFTRIRARHALQSLAAIGITPASLASSIAHLAAARAELVAAAAAAAQAHVTEQAGTLGLSAQALAGFGPDLRRRLLIAMIRWMNGAAYPPREAQLETLTSALAAGRDATLGGCRFRHRQDRITISREPRAVMGPVPADTLWDHRWQMAGPYQPDLEIRALGADGLRLCPGWRDLAPRDALIVSPSVWHRNHLIAAPLAGKPAGWQAKLGPTFGMFILSH